MQLPLVVLRKLAHGIGRHPSWAWCESFVPPARLLGVCAFAALKRQFHLAVSKCMQQSTDAFFALLLTGLPLSIVRSNWSEHRLALPTMEARLSWWISPFHLDLSPCFCIPSMSPSVSSTHPSMHLLPWSFGCDPVVFPFGSHALSSSSQGSKR